MDSLDTIVEQLQSKYVEPAKNKTDDRAAILVNLGYLTDGFQVLANASELIESAFETFRLDLDQSNLLPKKEIKRLKDLYPVDVDLKLLEYCVDIDEGPKFDKLPEFGSQNLKTRILHYRLNLLGLYEQPISSYFSAKSYSALSGLSSLIGKNLLSTLNLLSNIQEFTCAYLKQTGYQHPIVIIQSSKDKSDEIEDFTGAFKRSVKRELGGHQSVFESLKDGLFKRNDDKVDIQEALSIFKNDLNSFTVRLIQVHQRIIGLYDGAIDGEIGPITIKSLQDIINSYEEGGEQLAQKKLLVVLSRKDHLIAFNAIFFLNRYKQESQTTDKTIETVEKINSTFLQADKSDQQLFEKKITEQLNPKDVLLHHSGRITQRIFGGIRAFFKKAFRFGKRIFKWIIKGIKSMAGFIEKFIKNIISFLKEAAYHFIQGVKFLIGKTTITSGSSQGFILTNFDLDKDVLNIDQNASDNTIRTHIDQVGTKVSELKFSLNLISFLFRTIKAILIGGIVAWPLFILKLVKSFKELENSYKQITTT